MADGEISLRSRETDLALDDCTTLGEYEDTDVGVVSLLLQGPAEPEYCVDGLLTEGTVGVDNAVRFMVVAAANACSSGISPGGSSLDLSPASILDL